MGKRKQQWFLNLFFLLLLHLRGLPCHKLEHYLDPEIQGQVNTEVKDSLVRRQPRFFLASTTTTISTFIFSTSTSCFTTTAAITTACTTGRKKRTIDTSRIRFADGSEMDFEEWIRPTLTRIEEEKKQKEEEERSLIESSQSSALEASRDPRFLFFSSTFTSTSTTTVITTTRTTTFTIISCTPASAISLCGIIG